MQNKPAYLILANGRIFEGKSVGYEADAIGELVFTTAMSGYIETLTDPSFYGQIVISTFPLVGDYGVTPDFESDSSSLSAYILRDLCQEPSNFRCEGALGVFLRERHIPALADIDTRALTRIVRESGTMAAKLTHTKPENLDEILAELAAFKVENPVAKVTSKEIKTYTPEKASHRVVLWDFGTKNSIREELLSRGCEVVQVPADTSAETILSYNPEGILLSSGPGDPTENSAIIEELKKVLDKKLPTMGIDLGHQLAALAMGFETEKLKYGHRGENQPAIRTADNRVFITAQNHGYAIVESSLGANARVSYRNGNDGTVEGIEYLDRPMFTVEFHPEAAGGPLDTVSLFDKFVDMIKEGK